MVYTTAKQILNIAAEDFSSTEMRDAVLELVLDVEASEEFDEARLLAGKLEEVSDYFATEAEEERFGFYSTMLAIARLTMGPELGATYIASLLSEFSSFMVAYPEVDVLGKIRMILAVYENDPPDELSVAKLLVEGLEQSHSVLGSETSMTVESWIAEYNRASQWKKGRGGLERAQFMSESKNSQSLLPEERASLGKLLDLYDWLFNRRQTLMDKVKILPATPPPSRSSFSNPLRPVNSAATRPSVVQSAPRPQPVTSRAPLRSGENYIQPRAPIPQGSKNDLQSIVSQRSPFAPSQRPDGSQPMSLSHALANAGQLGSSDQGNIRIGRSGPGPMNPPTTAQVPIQRPTPVQAIPSPTPKPATPATPPKPNEQITSLLKNYPSSPQGSSVTSAVVDLSKRPSLEVGKLVQIADLQKIQLSDVEANFDTGLAQVKSKIVDLASANKLPVKQVLNYFYRSPLYNLYVAMAVAVMNDSGSDQKIAFEKVQKNYQSAKKSFLSREQFLALNKFKKDIASLP